MEDLSVDTTDMERKEILAKLGLTSSRKTTDKLKTFLKNSLMKNHQIHNYLSQLSSNDLKSVSLIVLSNNR